jgi:hypothetical protein
MSFRKIAFERHPSARPRRMATLLDSQPWRMAWQTAIRLLVARLDWQLEGGWPLRPPVRVAVGRLVDGQADPPKSTAGWSGERHADRRTSGGRGRVTTWEFNNFSRSRKTWINGSMSLGIWKVMSLQQIQRCTLQTKMDGKQCKFRHIFKCAIWHTNLK